MENKYDVILIGAGVVGLSTALHIQDERQDLSVLVLEKEAEVAGHQSSHNSGVLHSGIYYKPGSLRAINCKKGYDRMLDFCKKHDIPHEVCGKIIVATNKAEAERLGGILERGQANGLAGIRRISGEEAREIEPNVQAQEAIWVPQAGIVNYETVARKYKELILKNGGAIHVGSKVKKIIPQANMVQVETTERRYQAACLVNCAGLYSDKIAQMAGLRPKTQILPFRGEYYELKPESQHLVRNLIYPLPNPAFPFLGVHFTRMIEGGIEAGPNAVFAFGREAYHKSNINLPELFESLGFPGLWQLAKKYHKEAWLEFQRSYSKAHFVKALQKLIPSIQSSDLAPGRNGVRAMACAPNGDLLDDFLFIEVPRMVHVLNAPSPAATASLAIGETVAEKVLKQF
jgi:L-2-hydroxyglutarate oxidase